MARLEPGASAPSFTLPDQDGNDVSLADFAGRRVIVYFYSADDTPGCTKEACQFNDNLAAFDAADVPVIGISPDDAESHVRFRKAHGLRFPLLSDPDHAVMERYGAWGEKTLYGRKTVGVVRSTFLVDEQGRVAKAWYNVRSDGHALKVLAEVASGSALTEGPLCNGAPAPTDCTCDGSDENGSGRLTRRTLVHRGGRRARDPPPGG